MKLLHKIIFWSHLIAGVIAGAVIFLMSATGVILMYEHQLVEYAERDVRNVVPPVGAARLSLDEIVAKAHAQNPDARPTGLFCEIKPLLRSRSDSVARAPFTSILITAQCWAGARSSTTGFTT